MQDDNQRQGLICGGRDVQDVGTFQPVHGHGEVVIPFRESALSRGGGWLNGWNSR